MTTFTSCIGLPADVKGLLLELEVFIGDMDGQETDEGTVDADDAVKAFNGIVDYLRQQQKLIADCVNSSHDRMRDPYVVPASATHGPR